MAKSKAKDQGASLGELLASAASAASQVVFLVKQAQDGAQGKADSEHLGKALAAAQDQAAEMSSALAEAAALPQAEAQDPASADL